MPKKTSFKVAKRDLYVGDMVALYGGNLGFFEVIERDDGYYLTDCSAKVFKPSTAQEITSHIEDEKVERDLSSHYSLVDKKHPLDSTDWTYMECEGCDGIVGHYDPYTSQFEWYDKPKDDTGRFMVYDEHILINDNEVECWCKECIAKGKVRKETPEDEIMAYFYEQYENLPVKVLPGHWPNFKSKEEVDQWIALKNKLFDSFNDYFD